MFLASLLLVQFSLAHTSASPTPLSPRWSADVTYSVYSGKKVIVKDQAPVGLSFEFFAWPEYSSMDNQYQCLKNLEDAAGAPTRVRIGGTTQDRAMYDPNQAQAVEYQVATRADAPLNLTYGPSFFDLASDLPGPTIIGLNRRLNELNNSIAAATQAASVMDNLYAFELGNEPNLYAASSPITQNKSWTPAADAASQIYWQKAVSKSLGRQDIVQAGVWIDTKFNWSVSGLAPQEVSSGAIDIVSSFSEHNYPQSACGGSTTNLSQLMNHTANILNVAQFEGQVAAGDKVGKDVVFGETNSATCGGGGISPTFSAGIWVADYALQAVLHGLARLYYHQGTVDYSPYSFWGSQYVFAPYYGAYFATSALGGASHIAQLDDGSTDLAVYALYCGDSISKVAILNTAYYPNTTTTGRPSQTIKLTDVPSGCSSVSVSRLTADFATSQQELGQLPSYAGQSFTNDGCALTGDKQTEYAQITGGAIEVQVGASEAVLVVLKS